jgi:hypothetical protein
MKQLWLGLLATLITLPIPCEARPNQEGAYEVLGVGTISCEVWTKNRADKSNDRNFINGAWIQGYLTAVNVFGDGPSHLAKGTDAEGIMTWIDNYCAQHPGDSLTVAAKALVNELTEKGDALIAKPLLNTSVCEPQASAAAFIEGDATARSKNPIEV